MTARCFRISRTAAIVSSASSRPTSATSPTAAAFRRIKRYFGAEVAREVKREHGAASVVTAANCFAHIEDVHAIVDGIVEMLTPDGVFISESHYLIRLLDTLQYDTIYHEHLRYYSLTSLKHLLEMHDLEVFHARPIPSHGGSIRVYAARSGTHTVQAKRCSVCWRRAARRSDDASGSQISAATSCFPSCGCCRCCAS